MQSVLDRMVYRIGDMQLENRAKYMQSIVAAIFKMYHKRVDLPPIKNIQHAYNMAYDYAGLDSAQDKLKAFTLYFADNEIVFDEEFYKCVDDYFYKMLPLS